MGVRPRDVNSLEIRVFSGQGLFGSATVGLEEYLIELRVAAEARSIRRLGEGLRIDLSVLFKETGESHGIAVLSHWNAHLTAKNPTQMKLARTADLRQLLQT